MPAFDFSTLQQKADNTLHNADEAIRKLSDLAVSPNPVQIQLYDQNGNLITHNVETIPMQQAKVDGFIANARKEFGSVNLLTNSDFMIDSNADGFPDNFYTYYPGVSATYSLIIPDRNAAAGTDQKIASQILAKALFNDENQPPNNFWLFLVENQFRVLKANITLNPNTATNGTNRWSLNQNVKQISKGSVITRGASVYIPSIPSGIEINVFDNPGGTAIDGVGFANQPGFYNLYAVDKDTQSGHLGFLLNAVNNTTVTQTITLYIGFPVFALGHIGNLFYIPSVNK